MWAEPIPWNRPRLFWRLEVATIIYTYWGSLGCYGYRRDSNEKSYTGLLSLEPFVCENCGMRYAFNMPSGNPWGSAHQYPKKPWLAYWTLHRRELISLDPKDFMSNFWQYVFQSRKDPNTDSLLSKPKNKDYLPPRLVKSSTRICWAPSMTQSGGGKHGVESNLQRGKSNSEVLAEDSVHK